MEITAALVMQLREKTGVGMMQCKKALAEASGDLAEAEKLLRKQGVASAYGHGGTFMQCEYRMNTPVQGAGTCTFSSGARYKLHIGS